MIIRDAFWETSNLGYPTVEIEINSESSIQYDRLIELEKSYKYLVVKTPISLPSVWQKLTSIGYCIIECQIEIYKRITNNEIMKYAHFFDIYSTKRVDSKAKLQNILFEVKKGIFTTDRIAIDPSFGVEYSSRRYSNWILSMYGNCDTLIDTILVDNLQIGFACNKIDARRKTLIGLLGGIYMPYQKKGYGLGMLSPVFQKYANELKYHRTSVSLNNLPVLRLYQFLGYQVTNCKYVFTKLIKE